ncbi:MAG TPA: hypothetical protein VD994_11235 [Prosthecobacter sp.]|nr:hypothetical protein [Prosthecobacter sp.]
MNSPSPSPSAATFANALPKLAALTLLVLWGREGGQIPVGRLSLVFGVLALTEALTAAALEKQRPVLDWSDLGAVMRNLFGPAALPFYTLVAAGVFFLGEAPDTGRRMSGPSPSERGNMPPRVVPAPRSVSPGVNVPQGPQTRPGMPGAPSINFGPKAPAAASGPQMTPPPRPTPTNSARPPTGAPGGGLSSPPAPIRVTPPTAPTAPAAPTAPTGAAESAAPTTGAPK